MTWAHFAHLLLGFLLGIAPYAIKLLTKRYNGTDPLMQAIHDQAMRNRNYELSKPTEISCTEKSIN